MTKLHDKMMTNLRDEPRTEGVRVSKLMAERGLCSRREADEFIAQGLVSVNGETVRELGTRAAPDAVITLKQAAHRQQANRITVLFNKPLGVVSGQPEPDKTPAIQHILPETHWSGDARRIPDALRYTPAWRSHLRGLAPAGRLDIDSTGLLVLTQDGRIAKQLIGENSPIDKEYRVRVRGQVNAAVCAELRHGMYLDGLALKPAQVDVLETAAANSRFPGETLLQFILVEGRKRQIRRMCEAVGLDVMALKRIRIGGISLGKLPPGEWRYLGEQESFGADHVSVSPRANSRRVPSRR